MRKFLVFLCVVIVVCCVQGLLYAPHGGGGHGGMGRGPGPGPGLQTPPADNKNMTYVDGIIKTVKLDERGDTGTITIAGKDAQGHQGVATFVVDYNTQIFIGDEPKKLGDLAEGSKVTAGFTKTRTGDVPLAMLIRVLPDKKTADKEPPKPAAPKTDDKEVVEETK